ncbi:unnamed protein product, partial [Scytosiphon promiscuus]
MRTAERIAPRVRCNPSRSDGLQRPQGAELRIIKLEERECKGCMPRGGAGDGIQEDGVFEYNGNVVIE